ncbi:MAG: hypothetical protein IPI62_13270 [Bacteroidetes bacterium]|nr:hypothetical protein [Bacteroidota bacterium]
MQTPEKSNTQRPEKEKKRKKSRKVDKREINCNDQYMSLKMLAILTFELFNQKENEN